MWGVITAVDKANGQHYASICLLTSWWHCKVLSISYVPLTKDSEITVNPLFPHLMVLISVCCSEEHYLVSHGVIYSPSPSILIACTPQSSCEVEWVHNRVHVQCAPIMKGLDIPQVGKHEKVHTWWSLGWLRQLELHGFLFESQILFIDH